MLTSGTLSMHTPSLRAGNGRGASSPIPGLAGFRWLGLPSLSNRPFDIRPATTAHQQRAAGSLVRRMYTWRGYRTAFPLGTADQSLVTLAAWQGEEIVATLTLGRDSPAGLLGESLYPKEINQLRRPKRLLCEISRLAVDPDFSSPDLLPALFRAAQQYAQGVFGATDAVIEVNPRHAGYYEKRFGFRRLGDLRRCPRVDAPAVLMHREFRAPNRPGLPPLVRECEDATLSPAASV